MRIPWFDKENNIWVDKEEYENVHGIQKTEAEQEAKDASEEMKNLAKSAEAAPVTSEVEEKKESFAASITVEDDDLPF